MAKPDYALLGLLARRPATGYDLGKWLRTEGVFLGRGPSMSPVYRALAELESRGWIEATTDRRAGPDARLHRVTPAGAAALEEWARTPFEPAPRPMAPDFIVRLNFAGQLGPEVALEIVRTELEFRVKQRAAEGGPSTGLGPVDPIAQIDRDWLAFIDWTTHDRGWTSTSTYIAWLELLERRLVLLLGRPVADEEGAE